MISGVLDVPRPQQIARKLRRIILLHIGSVTVNFHFPKTEKSSFSCISDLVDMSMTPEPIILDFGDTEIFFKKDKKNPQSSFGNVICGNLEISNQKYGNSVFQHFWKVEIVNL